MRALTVINMLKVIRKNYKAEKKALKAELRARRREYAEGRRAAKARYRLDVEGYYLERGKALPQDPPKRSVLEEIGNSVTHGVGSLFSVAAFVLMLLAADGARDVASAIVYFVGLFVMFTNSCLYHSFPHGSRVKRIFRRFDYSSIYLLIGATFAPILLSYVASTTSLVFFIVQWAIIAAGISFVGVFGPTRLRWLHIPLYVLLGWSAVFFIPTMLARDVGLFLFIVLGGVTYTLGIIPFAIKAKVSHFIWHFFVLAGAVVQWIGIYLYIFLK